MLISVVVGVFAVALLGCSIVLVCFLVATIDFFHAGGKAATITGSAATDRAGVLAPDLTSATSRIYPSRSDSSYDPRRPSSPSRAHRGGQL